MWAIATGLPIASTGSSSPSMQFRSLSHGKGSLALCIRVRSELAQTRRDDHADDRGHALGVAVELPEPATGRLSTFQIAEHFPAIDNHAREYISEYFR